ncbi:hypothetical protein KQX54_017222 [Cotesia glomerata]|uniref:Uncharacterized protein n=1 Tax=Cotesia glomerata TaxID=32391 RepID=A0AAV7HST4_COTGL|nr:hypothetical protein KQX54_017222 [Cotesia glomerata]
MITEILMVKAGRVDACFTYLIWTLHNTTSELRCINRIYHAISVLSILPLVLEASREAKVRSVQASLLNPKYSKPIQTGEAIEIVVRLILSPRAFVQV